MVRTTACIDEMARLLKADEGIRNRLMGKDHVFTHRLPEPPQDEAWSRLVVREVFLPQGMPEHASGLVQVHVQIMAECNGVPDPDLLLETIHERAQTVLTGETWTSAYGSTYLSIERYSRPNAARWDDNAHCFYSTSTYLVTLS